MTVAWWWNTTWMASCLPELRSFHRATSDVADTQRGLLIEMLRSNCQTIFGRRYNFAGIRDIQQFQEVVPMTTYSDYRAAVDRIAAGALGELTGDRVFLLEPTSGTTSGEKLIPYTPGLRRQFQRAISAWIADLLWHRPAIRNGRSYWSISPAGDRARATPAGIPIGFDDDSAYLGIFSRWAANQVLAIPPNVRHERNLREFKLATLCELLNTADLTLISVWSPTFLTTLLAELEANLDQIGNRLSRRNAQRAKFVIDVLNHSAPVAERLQMCWPRLSLISCWGDGAAALSLQELRDLFPSVEIQPKGLLATEGVVSFPLVKQPAPVLAIRSHFFEFEEFSNSSNSTDLPRLAHEVETGGRYRVVITTGGGLYRYQLRDEVEVVGFLRQCPVLRFLGKSDRVSDRVGEKLSEPHVREVFERVTQRFGLHPRFMLLAPRCGFPESYVLYWQVATKVEPAELLSFLAEIDLGLKENPYYRHAVDFGQLSALQLCVLRDDVPIRQLVEAVFVQRGQRVGDIKPMCLETGTEWYEYLVRFAQETIAARPSPTTNPR